MTEGEFVGQVAEITAKVTWMSTYRQKWLLIRHYCEEALDIQAEQKRFDRSAYDLLHAMVEASKVKVAKIDTVLPGLEAELKAAMKEVDPDAYGIE